MAIGTVKFFRPEKGWGAIASAELPDGCDAWVHFNAIEGEGFRSLDAGERVEFDYESAQQDSFRYRATRVRRIDTDGRRSSAEG
ncbi:Cold shock-like protein CspLA [Nocardia cerradoensis]|uniref:Cold shock-like protein CspLA n=1 Tax=Nocardia cerradoensis TaxID=85688 RepID=A0A231HES0_9NOCA|nr:cold shock domain-containing protein [Nocardia cerradoensis]OXR47206.1 Cold shock-like protein CspLA [Nocardia cerradoensis]